jgi:hypothetical protein
LPRGEAERLGVRVTPLAEAALGCLPLLDGPLHLFRIPRFRRAR